MRWARITIAVLLIFALSQCRKDVSIAETVDNEMSLSLESSLLFDSIVVDTSNVSGIDYPDGIYDLTTGIPDDSKVTPVYHSNTSTQPPCSARDTATANGCIFDETDLDGNGVIDIIGANKKRLKIDNRSGVIDLKASLDAGVFGATPVNGMRRTFKVFYRLDDDTQKGLQSITIQLVHYRNRTDIPESLINEVAVRRQQYNLNSSTYSGTSLLAYTTLYAPKRPPLIVIVSGK